jgi:glycosyltransferase involved in cell wall biosynthesis
MKILLVSSGSGSRGGGEIFLDYLARGLADRGHEVIVWIPSHPRMDELANKCIQFARVIRANYRNTYDHSMRSLSTCFNWKTSRRLARDWERLSPDVIHLNKQNLEDGLDLLRAARWSGIPSICTIHLTQTAKFLRARAPRFRDWIARNALRKYQSTLVAVQEARRAELHSTLDGRVRTETVFNGVPLQDLDALRHVRADKRKQLNLSDNDFLVLGVGRLVEQKNPFVFLETAKQIYRLLPTAKFLWVGDGELADQWKARVAEEDLGEVISCVGWQDDPLSFLLAADLLLHVGKYEGLPLAIIEAMAAGLVCAVTPQFASEISLFDEHSVLFLQDPKALVKQIGDDRSICAVRANARRLAQNQLSTLAMTSSYERLYAKALQDDR